LIAVPPKERFKREQNRPLVVDDQNSSIIRAHAAGREIEQDSSLEGDV
jgi:hypothetical protein